MCIANCPQIWHSYVFTSEEGDHRESSLAHNGHLTGVLNKMGPNVSPLPRQNSIHHNSVPRFPGTSRDAFFVHARRDPIKAQSFGPKRL
jgi:hypothetical protein